MNGYHSDPSGQELLEYNNVLRSVLAKEYQEYSDMELNDLLESIADQMQERDAEEFFGLLTGIATAVAPTLIKGIGSLFSKRKRRRKQTQTRPPGQQIQGTPTQGLASSTTSSQQSSISQQDALHYLSRMIRDPRFLSTLAGTLINNTAGQPVGNTGTRIVTSKGGVQEVNDITFPAYMNALGYLAQKAAGNAETIGGRQEFSYLTDAKGQFRCNPFNPQERAEMLISKLFAADTNPSESWESDEYFEESDWYQESNYEYEDEYGSCSCGGVRTRY